MRKLFDMFCRLAISFLLWMCCIWLFELDGFIVFIFLGLCLFLAFSDLIIISLIKGIEQFVKSEEDVFRK